MPKGATLTGKQEKFCRAYVANNHHGSKAAVAAGYSPKSCRDIAWELLTKPAIQDRVKLLTEKALSKIDTNGDRILQELIIIGLADIAQYVETDDDGATRVRSFHELPFGATRAIKKIREKRTLVETKVIESGTKEVRVYNSDIIIELHDKDNALGLLARKYEVLRPADPDKSDTNIYINMIPASKAPG